MLTNDFRESVANISNYVPEYTYFEQRRKLESKGFIVKKLDSKWSDGSSPIILVKYKYYTINKTDD